MFCASWFVLFYFILYFDTPCTQFFSQSPALPHCLTHKQSEPCKEPFALFQKLLSWAIRKDEERKHDLFRVLIWRLFSLHGYFIREWKRCCVCVCECKCVCFAGRIEIQVHAWVIKHFARYWSALDGHFCSKGDPLNVQNHVNIKCEPL